MSKETRRASMIEQFIEDYDAGRIRFRCASYAGVTQAEIDAGAEPLYVAYSGIEGPYCDALHNAFGDDD